MVTHQYPTPSLPGPAGGPQNSRETPGGSLQPGSASPLYIQLRRELRTLIQKGEWKPEAQLPAVPKLAQQWGVHRLTVLKAIAGLKHTGWIQTIPGRGSFVATRLPEVLGLPASQDFPYEGSARTRPAGELVPWLETTQEWNLDPRLTGFSPGTIPPELLPETQLQRAAFKALKFLGPMAWGDSQGTGYAPYLDAVRRWLAGRGEPIKQGWGIRSLAGIRSGLALAMEAFTLPGDQVLVGSPCDPGLLALIRTLGRVPVPVPVDRQGLNTDRLRSALQHSKVRLLFAEPDFHTPTGTTLSKVRRQQVLALTRAHGVVLVSDSAHSDLRFEGPALPPLHQMEDSDHVIHLGSFSRILAAGINLGFLMAEESLLHRMARLQEVQSIAQPPLVQAVVAHLLDSGDYRRHLGRLRRALRKRRDAMLQALTEHFPAGTQVSEPRGGMHLWVVLPETHSTLDLHRRAVEQGLHFAPGPLCFADGRGTNCLCLDFSCHEPATTREAIARLGELVQDPVQGDCTVRA